MVMVFIMDCIWHVAGFQGGYYDVDSGNLTITRRLHSFQFSWSIVYLVAAYWYLLIVYCYIYAVGPKLRTDLA